LIYKINLLIYKINLDYYNYFYVERRNVSAGCKPFPAAPFSVIAPVLGLNLAYLVCAPFDLNVAFLGAAHLLFTEGDASLVDEHWTVAQTGDCQQFLPQTARPVHSTSPGPLNTEHYLKNTKSLTKCLHLPDAFSLPERNHAQR
jgi:hypothetical protein